MKHPIRALSAAALVAAASACGSDAPSAPASRTLDLSSILAQIAGGGVASVPGVSASATGATAPAIVPASCTYSTSSQGFVCPTTTSSGLTFSATFWLYDAAGHAQTQPDVATTASVRAVSDVKGTFTVAADTGGSMAVTAHSDMTLSGLLTSKRLMNGTTTAHDDLAHTGSSSHTVTDVKTVAKDVGLSTDTASPWPSSGVQTVDVTSNAGSLNFTVHSVVTYTGNGVATITTTVNGLLTTTCKIDLSGKTAAVCN